MLLCYLLSLTLSLFLREAICSLLGNNSHGEITSITRNTKLSLISVPDTTDPAKCYESWSSYYKVSRELSTRSEPSVVTAIYVTIQSTGSGSLYTIYDGVPRFKFHSAPTVTKTSTVTVISTLPAGLNLNYTDPQPPKCRLGRKFCDTLREAYARNRTKAADDEFTSNEDTQINDYCPVRSRECNIGLEEEIVLIYWPSVPAPREHHIPTIVTTSAITFRGQDLYRRGQIFNGTVFPPDGSPSYVGTSVLSGPFTFTSPTVYVAHHPINIYQATISMNDPLELGFHGIFSVAGLPPVLARSAGIIALKPDDVGSVRPIQSSPRDGISYPRLVVEGEFNPNIHPDKFQVELETVEFDFRNLQDPVPASVYYDARWEDCWGKQSHCGTITDDTYRPKIAIKKKVWSSLLPQWSNCWWPQLVDPPVALSPAWDTTLASPTMPQITQAQPRESLCQQVPFPTAGVRNGDSTSEDRVDPAQPTAGQTSRRISSLTPAGASVVPVKGQTEQAGQRGSPKPTLFQGSAPRFCQSTYILVAISFVCEILWF